MMKVRKKLFTLSGLFMVLAQIFVAAFCGITAIAVTQEETTQSLYSNEYGSAAMSYELLENDRIKWTLTLAKTGQQTATQFMVDLAVDGTSLVPENVTSEGISLIGASSNGHIQAGLSETATTMGGSGTVTFETARAIGTLTATPRLITSVEVPVETPVTVMAAEVTTETPGEETEAVQPAEEPPVQTETIVTNLLDGVGQTTFAIPDVEVVKPTEPVEPTDPNMPENDGGEVTGTDVVEGEEPGEVTESEGNDSTTEGSTANLADQPTLRVSKAPVVNDQKEVTENDTTNWTSLRVEKTWSEITSEIPEEAKTVKLQLMRRVIAKKGENPADYEEYRDPYDLTYKASEIKNGVQLFEWNSLPVYDDEGGPYEYTVKELDNPYYEIIQNPDNPTKSAINSLTTVQKNSQTVWTYGDPSYIIIRDAQSWIVWTATHVPENEREEFALQVIEFGGEAGPPFNHFKALYDANKKEFVAAFGNITWVEGNAMVSQKKGSETVYTDITVTAGETGAIDVTVDFRGETSSWTQFFYGGHSMREVAVTNKYIKQNNITVEKKWMLDNETVDTNTFNTQEDIRLQLQRKIEGGQWENVPEGTHDIAKGSSGAALSHVFTAPEKIKVGDIYKEVAYRVIEKVKVGTEYTGDRVYGYATPTPEEPDAGDYIVTNTLLKTSLEFTKVGNDGESNLSGVTFSLTREGGGTWTNQTTGNDGKINFTGLPVGKYTLTEKATVAGYETAGPWYFEVVDSDGTLSLKWTDSTWVTEKASPIEDGKLVNKFKPFKFTVFKEDDLENALPGATFTLTGPDVFKPQTLPNANDSSARSTFVFTGLTAPGEYTLTEDEAPNGYIGLSAPIQLSISATGEVTINNQSVSKAIDSETGGYAFSYTVTNKQKVPLPATGGSGTMMFVTIGVLALTATGLYFLKRKDQEVA